MNGRSRPLSAVTALALALSASLMAASCGGDDGVGDLISACEKYCVAQAVPGCKNGLPEDSCKTQCASAPQAFGNVCIPELTATLDCASSLEFTCMMDFPTPTATGCLAEVQAFNKCQEDAPCQAYCKAAAAAGCAGGGEGICIETCKAEVDKQSFCDSDLGRVRACEGGQTLTCKDGVAKTALCNEEKLDFADCVSFDDPCAGYCFLAVDGGCGGGTMGDCITTCQTEMSAVPNCDSQGRQYYECAAREGVTCTGAAASVPECTTEKLSYDMCVKNGGS